MSLALHNFHSRTYMTPRSFMDARIQRAFASFHKQGPSPSLRSLRADLEAREDRIPILSPPPIKNGKPVETRLLGGDSRRIFPLSRSTIFPLWRPTRITFPNIGYTHVYVRSNIFGHMHLRDGRRRERITTWNGIWDMVTADFNFIVYFRPNGNEHLTEHVCVPWDYRDGNHVFAFNRSYKTISRNPRTYLKARTTSTSDVGRLDCRREREREFLEELAWIAWINLSRFRHIPEKRSETFCWANSDGSCFTKLPTS